MKKIWSAILIIFVIGIIILAYLIFMPATNFSGKSKFLFIRENEPAQQTITHQLDTGKFIRNTGIFNFIAMQSGAFNKITPGKFEIKEGESIFSLVRTLRNNHQTPSKLVINKLRTPEDLARLIGKNFSTDSITALSFFTNNDSLLSLGVDTNTLMTLIIPDTYFLNWVSSPKKILSRLKSYDEKFWDDNDRKQKAAALNLTPEQVYILASIVEEETNNNDEKGNIASVYYNRLNTNMYLGADPTIKFAMKNFGLKRIYLNYLKTPSPYNTYTHKGLPPGPICTPQPVTIDAVLNMPKTDYLFFVAKSDFSGYHQFTSNFAEHQKYAQLYQQALNESIAKKHLDSLNKTTTH
ncbi:MAG: endolytic transglycosylase MltG [Bacteroidetes bacterium]|nr:endolytic transglycosylase MltG [Bacteroidota bacterium]